MLLMSSSLSALSAHIVLARIDELKLCLVHRRGNNVGWEHVPGEHGDDEHVPGEHGDDEDVTEDDDDGNDEVEEVTCLG